MGRPRGLRAKVPRRNDPDRICKRECRRGGRRAAASAARTGRRRRSRTRRTPGDTLLCAWAPSAPRAVSADSCALRRTRSCQRPTALHVPPRPSLSSRLPASPRKHPLHDLLRTRERYHQTPHQRHQAPHTPTKSCRCRYCSRSYCYRHHYFCRRYRCCCCYFCCYYCYLCCC